MAVPASAVPVDLATFDAALRRGRGAVLGTVGAALTSPVPPASRRGRRGGGRRPLAWRSSAAPSPPHAGRAVGLGETSAPSAPRSPPSGRGDARVSARRAGPSRRRLTSGSSSQADGGRRSTSPTSGPRSSPAPTAARPWPCRSGRSTARRRRAGAVAVADRAVGRPHAAGVRAGAETSSRVESRVWVPGEVGRRRRRHRDDAPRHAGSARRARRGERGAGAASERRSDSAEAPAVADARRASRRSGRTPSATEARSGATSEVQYLMWDYTHGDIEVFGRDRRHLGDGRPGHR